MKKSVIYVHGKGGNAAEAEHYKPLLPEYDVIGFDYRAEFPWEAAEEFPVFFKKIRAEYDNVLLIANSIGAYFSMVADIEKYVNSALFVSPVVDMEKLITNMMTWSGVSEKELREKGEIPSSLGENLSWKYLSYVRENPVQWHVPTHILYGENDNLTSFETISVFAERINAPLSVMPNGEHWFHTEEQMRFLDNCVKAFTAK